MYADPPFFCAEAHLDDNRCSGQPAELYLLARARQAGLPVPDSWYGTQPPETAHAQWLSRSLFGGGTSGSSLPVLQSTPLPAEEPRLFQGLPGTLHTRGWLWITPEGDRFQDLSASSDQALPILPLWRLPEQPLSLIPRLQQLSAAFRRRVSPEGVCLHWGEDSQQLWLLAIEPARLWPEGGVCWRDLSLEESLPAQPEPLLLSLLEAAAEEISERWLRERSEAYRPAVMADQGRLFYQHDLIGQVTQQVQALSFWQFRFELQRQCQQLKQQQRLLMESFALEPPGLSASCQQLSAIYARLIGASLWPEQLLQRAWSELEQAGVLEGFARQHLSPFGKMLQRLCQLSDRAGQVLYADDEPPEKQLLRDPAFRQDWQIFLSDYGHRSAEELSLCSPRLAESARFLLPGLLAPWNPLGSEAEVKAGSFLQRPLWLQAAALLDGYLTFRSDALWTLAQLKRQLEVQIQRRIGPGQLPDAQAFWQLTLEEVVWLEQGECPPARWFAPHPAAQSPAVPPPAVPLHLTGRPLPAQLEREGWLWCPASPAETLPDTLKPWQAILVLKRLDPVHALQIMQASAVLLGQRHDFNGGLSVLREWGIPVISGLGQGLTGLSTGQAVRLSGGRVDVLPERL